MDIRDRLPSTIRALQREVGVKSYSYFHGIVTGKRTPSVTVAQRIEEATHGAIRWTEFFEHSPSSPEAA